jgi:hypothetical protein
MIEAEFEELDEFEDRLDLSDEDRLPWLESDEDEGGGGLDYAQLSIVLAGLLGLLALIVGGIWYVTNQTGAAEKVADGSIIEAPEGPYKVKPDNPGGKTFEGTGNVAPGVGEGQPRDSKLAEQSADAGAPGEDTTASSGAVVGVQVGAYGSRKRAEEGWAELTRNSAALEGVRYRIVKGTADIGTVYRLQALAADRASADRLCRALKADGLPCQVKP